MAGRARLREAVGRLALVLFGVMLATGLLEAGMQLGAGYVAATHPRDDDRRPSPDAAVRVMCLGDSNTYGLYYGKERAYPQALEQFWNAISPTPIHVVNLGFPGNNSSVLRNRLPMALRLHHPQVVTIMIGVNDIWSVPEPLQGETYRDGLWRVSRVYRLLSLMAQSWSAGPADRMPDLDPDGVGLFRPADERNKSWKEGLTNDLVAMIATITAAGARPVLLTYPANTGWYHQANLVTRAVASITNTLLIDLSPYYYYPACSDLKTGCSLLRPDAHPTAMGHQVAGNQLAVWFKHDNVIPTAPWSPDALAP
jgi:lysophospholipase L1-like esterase